MEKLRFAIQVITFTMALPVYFLAELNHDTNNEQQSIKEQTSVQVNYTKNGKDRTPNEAANGSYSRKPVYIHSSK